MRKTARITACYFGLLSAPTHAEEPQNKEKSNTFLTAERANQIFNTFSVAINSGRERIFAALGQNTRTNTINLSLDTSAYFKHDEANCYVVVSQTYPNKKIDTIVSYPACGIEPGVLVQYNQTTYTTITIEGNIGNISTTTFQQLLGMTPGLAVTNVKISRQETPIPNTQNSDPNAVPPHPEEFKGNDSQ